MPIHYTTFMICYVSGRTYWQPPTDARSLCLTFLACRRRSIVSTMILILRYGLHADDNQVYIGVPVSDERVPSTASLSASMTSVSGYEPADCGWTRPRRWSCGSAPASSWSKLTSTTSQCCRSPSRLSRARVTLKFSSTAGLHCQRTSERSVGPGTTNSSNCARSVKRKSWKNCSCGVYILSVGLLLIHWCKVCQTLYCASCSLHPSRSATCAT